MSQRLRPPREPVGGVTPTPTPASLHHTTSENTPETCMTRGIPDQAGAKMIMKGFFFSLCLTSAFSSSSRWSDVQQSETLGGTKIKEKDG